MSRGSSRRNPLLERAERRRAGAPSGARPSTADGEQPTAAATIAAGDGLDRRGSGDQPQRDRGAARHRSRQCVSRRRRRRRPARAAPRQPPAYSEWASAGTGGREDGDYNLEAFVSAETTLADHLAEQLALAIADPVRRMIGQYLIDLVDEAGYLTGDLAAVAEKLGAPLAEVEAVLAILQGFDPAGVCARNLTECLAHPAQGARPLRSGDAGAGRPSRSAGQARPRGAAQDLRRRRRGSRRHDRARSAQLNPKPGLAFGSTLVQPIVPDVFVRPGAGRRLPRRAQFRHAAEGAGQPDLSRRVSQERGKATATRPISPNACKRRPGSFARSTSAPGPS